MKRIALIFMAASMLISARNLDKQVLVDARYNLFHGLNNLPLELFFDDLSEVGIKDWLKLVLKDDSEANVDEAFKLLLSLFTQLRLKLETKGNKESISIFEARIEELRKELEDKYLLA